MDVIHAYLSNRWNEIARNEINKGPLVCLKRSGVYKLRH